MDKPVINESQNLRYKNKLSKDDLPILGLALFSITGMSLLLGFFSHSLIVGVLTFGVMVGFGVVYSAWLVSFGNLSSNAVRELEAAASLFFKRIFLLAPIALILWFVVSAISK